MRDWRLLAVEHQGQEPAGGGDLGDVPGFLPATAGSGALRELADAQEPVALALQSGVRRALDPLGIFNPGKG